MQTTTCKNKDGFEVRYIQLAHNEWDSKAGYFKVNVIYNSGREENADKEGLKRLVNNIPRF